ncbi:protein phosphatase 2C domain-containing protein [Streptomyces sp. NPDC052012]|uniref:protein phosphatase 2C domain-containing protein n=1 Tax=Streptomyces sp. NPDC052012 TaxID=3155051 RepID=UPI00344B3564
MSQQGGRPTGHEDDWWRQLYDDSTGDTGATPAPESLDDRFASAKDTIGSPPQGGAPPPLPAPRAPWEPPPPTPPTPLTFPPPPPGLAAPAHTQLDTAPLAELPRSAPGGAPSAGGESGRPVGGGAPTAAGPPGTSAAVPADKPPSAPAPGDARPDPAAGDRPGVASAGGRNDEGRPAGFGPPAPVAVGASPTLVPPSEGPPAVPSLDAARPALSDADPRSAQPSPPPAQPAPPPPAQPAPPRPARAYVGSRPPTYDPEPTALPAADPDRLEDLVPDTVLDGARYGACTLRAASVRGDSARYRGEPRRDALLTARFGSGEQALVLVAVATGARTAPEAHRAAAEACRWIGRAVGRSHARLVEDLRAARRGDLKSGLHRLTDRSLGRLRASAAEQGLEPEAYAATLRCLLLPADPDCRTRVFFGVGTGGLFRLRDGAWQDIEPQVTEVKGEPVVGFGSPPSETPEGDRLTMDLGIPTPPSPYEPAPEPPREPFRFRTSVARPGDTLLMCGAGLADPLRGEEELRDHLADRWSRPEPPGLAAFLADTQVRVKGYADDRTAAAVWEA